MEIWTLIRNFVYFIFVSLFDTEADLIEHVNLFIDLLVLVAHLMIR